VLYQLNMQHCNNEKFYVKLHWNDMHYKKCYINKSEVNWMYASKYLPLNKFQCACCLSLVLKIEVVKSRKNSSKPRQKTVWMPSQIIWPSRLIIQCWIQFPGVSPETLKWKTVSIGIKTWICHHRIVNEIIDRAIFIKFSTCWSWTYLGKHLI